MTMRKGSKGGEVATLQSHLRTLGYLKGRLDGDFGPKTKAAVVDFQTAYLVDGIVDEVTEKAITKALQAWTEAESVLVIPRPHGLIMIESMFGHIEYEEAGGGDILITNKWADDNIGRHNLPVVGEHLIHNKMALVFEAVFKNIKERGLDGKIQQFGVWSPRHKMHDPKRSLSTHSWGIACDINWATNPIGKVGDMDPGIIDSFERYGFQWGGRWGYRDDMHFQYATGH